MDLFSQNYHCKMTSQEPARATNQGVPTFAY